MSELQVTQCPFCKTHFRLTQEQLQAAAGNVRCGACLKVFNALPAGQDSPAIPAAPVASKEPGKQQTLLIHDDLELDELDLEALGLDESILDEITPRDSTEPTLSSQPDTRQASAGFELLDDDEPPLTLAETARRDDDSVEPGFSSLDSDDELELNEAFLATPQARDFGPASGQPEATAEAPEPDAEPEPAPATPPRAHLVPLQDTDNSAIFRRGQPEAPLHAEREQPETPTPYERGRTEPEIDSQAFLPELEDEPLQLAAPLSRRRARHKLLWGSLSLLALLALAAQALYYNLDAWARDASLRPIMEDLCLVAGCQLPARVDVSQIRSSNLLVRPHPEFPNSLDINVIIYNRADYAQPFPVIRMLFSNSRGETVSSKDFRPEEYLAGELAGSTLMPSQTPIHIALNMVAPGSQATSYQLDFVTP